VGILGEIEAATNLGRSALGGQHAGTLSAIVEASIVLKLAGFPASKRV
jgi:hypothetical protein